MISEEKPNPIENIIKYKFNNFNLLKNALTHSSYISIGEERYKYNNERLEFLGDAFFDAVISEELFFRCPDVGEGRLSKLRAAIVCENSLATQGHAMSLGSYLYMGKGEENTGGRKRDSIIADATEAIIGAIYMDGGFDEAKKFILRTFKGTIEEAILGKLNHDYKTDLQEKLQSGKECDVTYAVYKEEGPDHSKVFFVNALCDEKIIGEGQGKSKKTAEQDAAKNALERGGMLVF